MNGLDLVTRELLKLHAPNILNDFEKLGEKGKWLNAFVTQDSRMLKLKEEASTLACVNDPVLISGPSGTGKELVARILHGDRTGKFLPINCAGLPVDLVESELFGYVKGAFTGANTSEDGLLVSAKDGSIFLDEIGELPMSAQSKLLRAIQEMKIRKVSGKSEDTINCRFICATHRDLGHMCAIGAFRDDLFYRISMFELETTPLEERVKDIPLLIKALDTEGRIEDIDEFCSYINPKSLQGNVRILQKFVRRFYVLGGMPNE